MSALSFALVGYVVGVFQSGLLRSSRWIAPMLGGIGGLVGGALWVVIASVAGQDDLITGYTVRIVVLAAVYDALLAVLIFPFVHWACGNHDLAAAMRRSVPWADPWVELATGRFGAPALHD